MARVGGATLNAFMPEVPPDRPLPPFPPTLRAGFPRWLHLHALTTLAIAQPLYDQLGRNATFFVAHRTSTAGIITFTLAVFLVPALVLAAITWAVSLVDRRAARIVLGVAVALLVAMIFLPAFNRNLGQNAAVSIPLAAVLGAGAAVLYSKAEKARTFLNYIGGFSLVILGLFLFNSQVSDLLGAGDVAAAGDGGNDTDVVFVVMDEFALASIVDAEGNLDPTRAPNLAEFSATSTWYRNTTTNWYSTDRSVPTLLTGQVGDEIYVPIAALFPQNLFTLTAATHTIDAAEQLSRLCPDSICTGAAPSATEVSDNLVDDARVLYLHTLLPSDLANKWLPAIDDGWGGFGDEPAAASEGVEAGGSTVDAALDEPIDLGDADAEFDWIFEDLGRDRVKLYTDVVERVGLLESPSVSYAHLLLPHTAWEFDADGKRYDGNFQPGYDAATSSWLDVDPALTDQAKFRYLLQVQYTDRLLGQLFEQLRETGSFDETLIVLVSDHGISFEAESHKRVPDGARTLSDIAYVPFFVKYPGQSEGEIIDDPVSTLDVLPTVADVLEIELLEPIAGHSLIDGSVPTAERGFVGYPVDDFEGMLDLPAAVAHYTRVVPNGTPANEAYGTGPIRQMVGSAIAEFDTGSQPEIDVVIRNAGGFLNVDTSRPWLPSRVVVSVKGEAADTDGIELVAVVNGTVAGSMAVFDKIATILIDPTVLIDGVNTVEIYSYSDGGLNVVSGGEVEFSEASNQSGSVVVQSVGKRVVGLELDGDFYRPNREGQVQGDVGVTAAGDEMRGWALDLRDGSYPTHFVLVESLAPVDQPFEVEPRPGLVDATEDDRFLDAGFRVSVDVAEESLVLAAFADGTFLILNPEPA